METGRRGFRLPFTRQSTETGLTVAAVDAPPGRLADSFRAFRHRNYRLFYMGQGVSLIGTWMQTIAQAWLVLEITDSEIALGVVTMMQFLPIMLLVLFAGVIADRVRKREFLVLIQLLAMAQALVLATLVFAGVVELWHVYVLAFVLGIANAFDLPTRQSFVVEMVGRDDLVNAVSLNSGMFNGARLIGPAIGGFIISIFGVEAVFLLNGLSFIPILLSLTAIRAGDLYATEGASERRHPLSELQDGIGYALRTPATLLIIILVALIGMFGYNFTVMLPLITRYVLHEGSVALGLLTASVGLGALVMALVLAGRKAATHYQLFFGATAFTCFLAGVAMSESLPLTMLLLVGLGASGAIFGTTANTSIQMATPDHLRGRVVSLYMLLFAGSTPIGGYLTGFMAEQIGTQAAIGVLAVMCGVGVLAGALYYLTHQAEVARTADAYRTPA
jgi:MFS family permease